MEVHVHAEKKDGKKLKLRQFFIDASERERDVEQQLAREFYRKKKMKTQRNGNIEKCTLRKSDEREKMEKASWYVLREREREIDKARKENCENC